MFNTHGYILGLAGKNSTYHLSSDSVLDHCITLHFLVSGSCSFTVAAAAGVSKSRSSYIWSQVATVQTQEATD